MKKLIIHSDGGSRNNPGQAAIGVVVANEQGEVITTISRSLGIATNNQAEYAAVIAGLEKAKELKAQEVECFLDSELVVKQLKGEYKVKNKDLAPFFLKAYNLSVKLKKVTFRHIRREENQEADRLVNEALDNLE
ncbi:MAG: ribonuclease HI family protein [Patescibacteria group bacterium]|nr:MAG: ribonuclease HI family protein [Patescibacteria group bacterium]